MTRCSVTPLMVEMQFKRAGNNLWLGALGRLFDHGRAQEEGWHMLAKTERRIAIVIVSATG